MHDPTAIFRFDEHDIYIPMIVLEELDAGKKGLSEAARNVRQVSRFLDELMASATKAQIDKGLELPTAKYIERRQEAAVDRPAVLPDQGAESAACRTRCPATARTTRSSARRSRCKDEFAGCARHAGVEGHQPAHQGRDHRRARRGLLQRQDDRRRGPAVHRRAGAAGELLGAARQEHAFVAGALAHVLSRAGADGARVARQSVPVPEGLERPGSAGAQHRRQRRGDGAGARLSATSGTASGASRRATASRTSRSTCCSTRRSTS